MDVALPASRHKDKKSDRKQRDHADKPKTTSLLSFDDEGRSLQSQHFYFRDDIPFRFFFFQMKVRRSKLRNRHIARK